MAIQVIVQLAGPFTAPFQAPSDDPIQLSEGHHIITLYPADAETTSDSNDFYTAVINY